VFGVIDDLDDTAAVADAGVLVGFLDMQQDAVADAGGLPGPRLVRSVNSDFWRRAVRFFIPFVGSGENAREISRVPTLPGCLPMKARMSALEGREGVRLVCLFKIDFPAPNETGRVAKNVMIERKLR
jgi:hypothetical protein